MKAFITIFAASILIISCGSDDSGSGGEQGTTLDEVIASSSSETNTTSAALGQTYESPCEVIVNNGYYTFSQNHVLVIKGSEFYIYSNVYNGLTCVSTKAAAYEAYRNDFYLVTIGANKYSYSLTASKVISTLTPKTYEYVDLLNYEYGYGYRNWQLDRPFDVLGLDYDGSYTVSTSDAIGNILTLSSDGKELRLGDIDGPIDDAGYPTTLMSITFLSQF